jgi:hypothetical protein
MSLAMKRLKNIGWMALVCFVAILLYPLSLNVAALHSDLLKIDSQIYETKREIDFLEAEMRTRANLTQLEEWNDLLYGYKPPTAQQFLEGEDALASLDRGKDSSEPVMVAVAAEGLAPAGIIGSGKPVSDAGPKPLKQAERPAVEAGKPAISGDVGRTERLSRLDDQLLSDDALRKIETNAKKERARR